MGTELSKQDRLDAVYHDNIVQRGAEHVISAMASLWEINERALWRHFRCSSFSQYLRDRTPFARSTVYRHLKLLEADNDAAKGRDTSVPNETNARRTTSKVADSRGTSETKPDVPRSESEPEAAPEEAEPEPEVAAVLDGRKEPVTDPDLFPVFTAASRFDSLKSAVARLKGELEDLCATPAGVLLAKERQQAERERRNLLAKLTFSRPWAVCPYCRNGKLKPSCDGCQGRGWVNKLIFKQAPKEAT